jgi:hypothetical protein
MTAYSSLHMIQYTIAPGVKFVLSLLNSSLILGVCILLRVGDQVMGVFIRLCNVNIIGYFTTIYYIAICFSHTTIIRQNILMARVSQLTTNGSVVNSDLLAI